MEQSWLPIPPSSDFSLANIPFGIITTPSSHWPHPAIAIGEYALDLFVFSINDGFSLLPSIQPYLSAFTQLTLNEFASLGRPVHREVRSYLQDILEEYTPYPGILKDNSSLRQKALFPLKDVQMHLPLTIGDYTDFYAGLHHAYNVGLLFRGPDHALQPNYTHLPVGYHGRASSVVLSGTPIRRPWGQIIEDPNAEDKRPIMKPCRKLDIELEVGAFICKPSNMGEPIPIPKAHEHVFGLVLMNDWSARDIQAWEYVPLGPFGSKNFGTSISPWIVLADALEQFRVEGLDSGTTLLPYLKEEKKANVYDITLEVDLTSKRIPLYSFDA
ncbi:MAG: hypothetical protein M1819_000063 [Sarea resinae]|nr:MAG: hypothetical protein M1819_000063 [Sarea resinae]